MKKPKNQNNLLFGPDWRMLPCLDKQPATVSTVRDLVGCFNYRLMQMPEDYDEINLVFHTYRTFALKSSTRDKRRQGKASTLYHVIDDTNIRHIPMSWFLFHGKSKADLTNSLAAKILEFNMVPSYWSQRLLLDTLGARKTLYLRKITPEEADTLLINQAVLPSPYLHRPTSLWYTRWIDWLVLIYIQGICLLN